MPDHSLHTMAELAAKVYPERPAIAPPPQPEQPSGPQTREQLAERVHPDAGGDLRAALRPFMSGREAEEIVATSRQAWTRETARPAALKLLAAEFGEAGAKDALAAAGAMAQRLPPDVLAKVGNNPSAVLALARAAARQKRS